jgi:ATP-binding cassette, subfamily B, multidrug efflux pump
MSSLLQLFGFMRPYLKIAMLGPLFMTIEVAMDLLQPRLLQRIVDVGIVQLDMSIILGSGGLMILIAFVGVFGGAGGGFFAVRASQLFAANLRSALYRKVQSFSFGNLDKTGTGELITRLTNDVTQVQETVFISIHILVRAPLIITGSVIMAILTSPKLAFMFLILGPVVTTILVLVIRKIYLTFATVQDNLDGLNSVMLENLAGVRVVKAFVRAAYENSRFGRRNTMLKDSMVSALRVAALTMPLTMLILNIGIVGVIWFGGLQVNNGGMRVGEIIAFVNYLMVSLHSLMMFGMLLTRVSRGAASAKRLVEVLNATPDVKDKKEALVSFSPEGRVVFDNVTFNYDGDINNSILRDISFEAEPGQMVAILGATGSGKSSLINLIPRFYDVSKGTVSVDGVDVRNISQKALRNHIGIAMQDVVLFTGSIKENISYGRPDAPFAEILQASKSAQAHEFISSFPEGYESILGQRGVNLSGGQKQRIAIARALIKKPTILILDDSTSAVDVETESKLQEALGHLMKGRTSFVIAQRISTVLNADKIIVLDDGKIIAEGTHEQLLSSSPIYGEIYESQLGSGVA